MRKRNKQWTREELITALQVMAKHIGHTPSSGEMCSSPSHSAVIRHFGSWDAGIKAAGLKPKEPQTARHMFKKLLDKDTLTPRDKNKLYKMYVAALDR